MESKCRAQIRVNYECDCKFDVYFIISLHTIAFHVDLKTLAESARLTLISACDVDNTAAIFFTDVFQISKFNKHDERN